MRDAVLLLLQYGFFGSRSAVNIESAVRDTGTYLKVVPLSYLNSWPLPPNGGKSMSSRCAASFQTRASTNRQSSTSAALRSSCPGLYGRGSLLEERLGIA